MTKRSIIGMSGGVDSCVALYLLQQLGYHVEAVHFSFLKPETISERAAQFDTQHALKLIAGKFQIPVHFSDQKEAFKNKIITPIISEYLLGNTPNPCTLCNQTMKWPLLLEWASNLNCDTISTGHFCGKGSADGRHFIRMADDEAKDQSYMLWMLSQKAIEKAFFPLAKFSKERVRKMATEIGLDTIANQQESYAICFAPKGIPELLNKHGKNFNTGDVFRVDGTQVGTHKGTCFYTIGQIFKTESGKQYYVKKKDQRLNQLIVAKKSELFSSKVRITQLNFQKYSHVSVGQNVEIKIRGKERSKAAIVSNSSQTEIIVTTTEPLFAVAEGQSAVLYEGRDIICGGVIS